jgi:hypothetical protein
MSVRIRFHERNLWFSELRSAERVKGPFSTSIKFGSSDPRNAKTHRYLANKWVCEVKGRNNWLYVEGAHPQKEGAEKMAPVLLAMAYARFGKYMDD